MMSIHTGSHKPFESVTTVASLILAPSHTSIEIDHERISTAILLPSADTRRVVVSYKRKYMHKVLVNRLV